MSGKIGTSQSGRRAVVYLRQSTLKQVMDHRESTDRQYALRERAVELGWQPDQIDVIDEDLGQSGKSTEHRSGFHRVAEAVAHGEVGAIFALEVSRLSRCSADWHRLLDVCALADTVIADEQSVFAPGDYNDRLVLGMKGTMSEAELYWMKLRLHGGRMNKAQRGELRFHAPAGYEWDGEAQRFVQTPDQRVQAAIRLIFERFQLDGSAGAVVRYFAKQGLQMPSRLRGNGPPHWVVPRLALVINVLHNPIFAGSYAYGKTQEREGLVNGAVRPRVKRQLAQADWAVCLHDHHPAYITWEEFVGNIEKLQDNRSTKVNPGHGAVREGGALLQGIALCGRCGRRMSVSYPDGGRHGFYRCPETAAAGAGCFGVASTEIDAAVAELFLQAMQPAEIDLSLAVTLQVERQSGELEKQWKLRLEQAQYGARQAERRYMAVDPDNRVVARTLERAWEEKLREIEEIEREMAQTRQRDKVSLTAQDRQQILALARDLPAVWHSPTTTDAERKNLLRMAISDVTLAPVEVPSRQTRIAVLWRTGATEELLVARHRPTTVHATSDQALQTIIERFQQGKSDLEIMNELNAAGLRTGKRHAWTKLAVERVRHAEGLTYSRGSRRRADQREDGLLSIHGVAAHFDVAPAVVRYWRSRGWLAPVEGNGTGKDQWFQIDSQTDQELRRRKDHSTAARAHRRFGSRITNEV